MDTELLRTFLEVNRTRHFGKAAANLYVTSSAVSARIRQLEVVLGVPVFTRARNDIQLTPAGKKLLGHAETILTAWSRARQEMAADDEEKVPLSIGAVPGLWDLLLLPWLALVREEMPEMALALDSHGADTLLRRLAERSIDVAVVFEALDTVGFDTEPLGEVRFAMVASRPGLDAGAAVEAGYVYVHWGGWFGNAHARHFPDLPAPSLRTTVGRWARSVLRTQGGAAYLAEGMVRADLERGDLHRVAGAPVIARAVHAVYGAGPARPGVIEQAVALMRVALAGRVAAPARRVPA